MTKADLLRFLEPFTDDVKILIDLDMGERSEPVPRYEVAPCGSPTHELDEHGIGEGEGYILL